MKIKSSQNHEDTIQFLTPDADLNALKTGNGQLIQITKPKTKQHQNSAKKKRRALVIGANGFLGVHFILALAKSNDYEKIYCIVRPKNGKKGIDRIKFSMKNYQCEPLVNEDKIRCFSTTYLDKNFGLTDPEYTNLCESVDTVFHFASNTDYSLSYQEMREPYVLKNLEIMDFCSQGIPKRMHYVCTTLSYIFKDITDFQRPDWWWFSGYSKMKWVNRNLFMNAFDNGFEGTVYCPPYIIGRAGVGVDPAISYSYWRMILEMMQKKVIWEGEFFQIIPVDILCDIILENSLTQDPPKMLVPTVPTIKTSEVAESLGCEIISWDQFKKTILSKSKYSDDRLWNELTDEIIERANINPLGISDEIAKRLPNYIDALQLGLKQPGLELWKKKYAAG